MNNFLLFCACFFVTEIIVAFLFSLIAQIYYKKLGLDIKSIMKGVIERIFLTICLLNDYPHALTFFSALKLATRLKHNDSTAEDKFNDYYLLGNLASVIIAVAYVWFYKYLAAHPIL